MPHKRIGAHDSALGPSSIHIHHVAARRALFAALSLAVSGRLLAAGLLTFRATRRFRLAATLLSFARLTIATAIHCGRDGVATTTAAMAGTALASDSGFTRLHTRAFS